MKKPTLLMALLSALLLAAVVPLHAETTPSASIRFTPPTRAVGDVMPFYHAGEYHVFYLLNASGNDDINWEHAVSRDLVEKRMDSQGTVVVQSLRIKTPGKI